MFPQMLFRAAGPLSLILLIAGGCSSYDLQQMYSGPRKAPDDVARLWSTEHAFACQIDGRTLHQYDDALGFLVYPDGEERGLVRLGGTWQAGANQEVR